MDQEAIQTVMSTFTPSRRFRRAYDRIFRQKPEAANLMLLLAELADKRGEIILPPSPEAELAKLMAARFEDPQAYSLPGGPK